MEKYFLIAITFISFMFSSCKKDKEEALPIYDDRVVPYKIIDEEIKVGARISLIGNDNRVFRSITLPHRALYWCYWVGVGDDPVTALSKIAVPKAMEALTKDPFIAYGWKAIAALNTIQATGGNVDLSFCDARNKKLFEAEDPAYTPYDFFQCPQTITSYAIRETMASPILHDSTFYVTFRNMNPVSGEKVTFKVWAYVIKD